MTEIKWCDLTDAQKIYLGDGCGSKGFFIKVPQFMFTADCNIHDFRYWRGCTEADRKEADLHFYNALKVDAKDTDGYFKKYYYRFWAFTFYVAVRFYGSKCFYYGPKRKTLEDLLEEMKNNP